MENLPPLPEPKAFPGHYTADQMREYARAAVAALEQREPVATVVSQQYRWPIVPGGYSLQLSAALAVGTKLYTSPPTSADAVDAERYRWLREQPLTPTDDLIDVCTWRAWAGRSLRFHELDAAIDAAIAATKEKT